MLKKPKAEKKKKFDYRQNNWGFRGKDFVVGKTGKLKVHQTYGGTTYLVAKDGSLRKITPKLLDQLQKELDSASNPPADNSIDLDENNPPDSDTCS